MMSDHKNFMDLPGSKASDSLVKQAKGKINDLSDLLEKGENKPPGSTRLDSSSGQGDQTGKGDWVDIGVQDTSINDLPMPDSINGSSDFQKVSMPEMQGGLELLQEMKPYIDSGQGANSDYWSQVDQSKGLTYKDGYQRIYDAFYGNNAIRVNKDGAQYDIVNGRHRIWLAKRMGIDSLPMRVIEKQK